MDCTGCYWYNQCHEEERCDDYTPIDDSFLMNEYEHSLRERIADYAEMIDEMNS